MKLGCKRVMLTDEWYPTLTRPNARIEVRRETAAEFDRALRTALAATVWHTGCTNWYVDENGNDPNQWPWLWSTYRRRTAHIVPGAYELSALPAD